MDDLPLEIIFLIIGFCDPKTLFNFAYVNKDMLKLIAGNKRKVKCFRTYWEEYYEDRNGGFVSFTLEKRYHCSELFMLYYTLGISEWFLFYKYSYIQSNKIICKILSSSEEEFDGMLSGYNYLCSNQESYNYILHNFMMHSNHDMYYDIDKYKDRINKCIHHKYLFIDTMRVNKCKEYVCGMSTPYILNKYLLTGSC